MKVIKPESPSLKKVNEEYMIQKYPPKAIRNLLCFLHYEYLLSPPTSLDKVTENKMKYGTNNILPLWSVQNLSAI